MRLFVTVDPGDQVLDDIWAATDGVRSVSDAVRWVARDSMHITLKFLGEVKEEIAVMKRVVEVACGDRSAMDLAFDGFGAFPNARRPRVFWAGCDPDPRLELLQHSLETGFAGVGIESDGKPFRPHITLGRARRSASRAELASVAEAMGSVEFAATGYVDTVRLMASELSSDGAVYRCVSDFPLKAS